MTDDGEAAEPCATCVDLLRKRLRRIEARVLELVECSTIGVFVEDPDSSLVLIRPKYHWGDSDERQLRLQIELKGAYNDWFEQVRLLFSDAPDRQVKELEETDVFVRRWIEKEQCWELRGTAEENKATFRTRIGAFHRALDVLDDLTKGGIVLVPDTNALIRCPDPSSYATIAGGATYEFVLLPTVLKELDELKVKHRDQDLREKVEGVIRRIKGWGRQGDLLSGVTVDKTVTVRTVPREPDFTRTLRWLDRENDDDRIIASVLELQRAKPSAAILLVTGDVNLQNKAHAASLPHAEPPATKAGLPKPWEGAVLEEMDGPRYFDWGRRMLAVSAEDEALRMTPEFADRISDLLWERDDVSPQFDRPSTEPKRWVYETDRGRTWKRKLRADFDEQYLVAVPRREPPPPKCPECGRRSTHGANFCSHCVKEGRTVALR
jgi:hypothetical protein